jgi:dihydroorotate dehydrogenase
LAAFQGTDRGQGHQAFVDDHVKGVKMLKDSGAQIIEVNLSCPNEGSPQLLCFDTATTKEIVKAIRKSVQDIKLIVKVTYFTDHDQLKKFVKEIGPHVDGISAINTIAAKLVKPDGGQAYEGSVRVKPGISGRAVKKAALDMVKRLDAHRKDFKYDYKIIGIGGVLEPQDFHDMLATGADTVMSVTGAMWNPRLATEIKATLN